MVHVDGETASAFSRFLAAVTWLCAGFDNGFSTRRGIRQCPELAAVLPFLVMKLDACCWHCRVVLPAVGREGGRTVPRLRQIHRAAAAEPQL